MGENNFNLAIIVPFRDRRQQLDMFVPHMDEFLSDKDIDYTIVVVEQSDDRPFNRGKLLDIGFDLVKEDFDYFCFHDVDQLPITDGCDYSYDDVPIHLGTEIESYNYGVPYPTSIGGAMIFTKEDFETLNGYSTEYWGYGVEDLDMIYRMEKSDLPMDVGYEMSGVTQQYRYNIKNMNLIKTQINKELNYKTFDKSDIFRIDGDDQMTNLVLDSFSISVWFRPKEIPDTRETFQSVVSRPGRHTSISYGWDHKGKTSLSRTGYIQAQIWDEEKINYIVEAQVVPNKWYHVVMTVDNVKKELSMYVNGTKIYDKRNRNRYRGNLFEPPSNIWYVGSSYEDKNQFGGDIGDLRFFDITLDKQQVENLYLDDIDEKPITHIDFKRGYRNNLFDVSGNHKRLRHSLVGEGPELKLLSSENIKIGSEIKLPIRKIGRYKSLKHLNDDNMLEMYNGFDPDIVTNLNIFFEDIRTGDFDYKQVGLNNLKYKVLDEQDFLIRHKWIKVVT